MRLTSEAMLQYALSQAPEITIYTGRSNTNTSHTASPIHCCICSQNTLTLFRLECQRAKGSKILQVSLATYSFYVTLTKENALMKGHGDHSQCSTYLLHSQNSPKFEFLTSAMMKTAYSKKFLTILHHIKGTKDNESNYNKE